MKASLKNILVSSTSCCHWVTFGLMVTILAIFWQDKGVIGVVYAQDWEVRKKTHPKSTEKKQKTKVFSPNAETGSRSVRQPKAAVSAKPNESTSVLTSGVRAYIDRVGKNPTDDFAVRRLISEAQVVGGVGLVIEELDERVRQNPDDARHWVVLGVLRKVTGDTDKAIECFLRGTALLPQKTSYHEVLAEALVAQKRWEDALRVLETAATAVPADAFTLYKNAAETAFVAGLNIQARRFVDAALSKNRSKYGQMEIAEVLRNHGALSDALVVWERIRAQHRDQYTQMMAIREMATLLQDMGEDHRSIEVLRKGLSKARRGTGEERELRELLVTVYRRSARLQELVDEYRPSAGKDYELTALSGRLYEELGHDANAQKMYREAIRLRPTSVEVRRALIDLLERQGLVEDVIVETQRLIQTMRREPQLEVKLAELFARKGDKKRAIEILQGVGRRYSRDPTVQGMVMDQYVRLGASGELVLQQLLTLRKLEPREEAHILGLGEYYFTSGKRDLALTTWQKLLEVIPNKAKAHLLLATTLGQYQRNDLADQHFQEATAASPDDDKIRRKYSEFLVKQRKFDRAVDQWLHVLQRASKDARKARRARVAIVEIWSNSGMLRHKQLELRRRFQAGEGSALDDGRLLVAAYLVEHSYTKAEEVLSDIIEKFPDDLEALVALEGVYARTNRIEEARATALRLSELDNDNKPEHLARYADYAAKAGDTGSAIDVSTRLVLLNPTDARAQANVGDILWQQGDVEGAIRQYRRAVELGTRDFVIHMRLAAVYHERGLYDEEMTLLRKVMEDADDSPTILQAGHKLFQAASLTGKLQRLEDGLLALVQQWPQRPVYRNLLVDLYRQLGQELVITIQQNPADTLSRQRLSGLVDRGLIHLVEALQDDVGTRTKVLEILRNTRSPHVVLPSLRLLEDPDRQIRGQAAIAVAFGGAEAAITGLERLVDSPDIQLRPLGVWALGTVRAPQSLGKLADVITAHGSPDLRALACLALGIRGLPDAVPVLKKATASSVDSVIASSIWALGMIGVPEATPDVVRFLGHSSNDVVRVTLWTLGRLGGPVAQQALLRHLLFADEPLVDVAVRGLCRTGEPNEPDDWKVTILESYLSMASFELGRMNEQTNSHGSVRALLGRETTVGNVSQELAVTLAANVVAIVNESAAAKDDLLLEQVLDRLLGRNASPVIEPIYLPPLDGTDTHSAARAASIDALRPLGPSLVVLLDSAKPGLRAKIYEFVGKIGMADQSLVRRLMLQGLHDSDASVQRAAIRATGWLKDDHLTDALIDLGGRISAGNFGVQAAWAEAVSGLGDRRAVPILQTWLTSDFPTVRVQVIYALGMLGDAGVVPKLLLEVRHPDPRVVEAALTALGNIGDVAALKPLQNMLSDCAITQCERIQETMAKIRAR